MGDGGSAGGTDAAPPRASGWRPGTPVLVFLGALAVHGLIQAQMAGFPDRDAWFHARYAELLGRGEAAWHGAFPWITQSAWAAQPMDWSLLWHALLVPFTLALGPFAGMKAFVAAQAALLTTVFFTVLRAQRVRAPLLWTALLLAASPEWLFRLHFGRPTPFVVATLLIVFHLVLARRDVLAGLTVAASLLLYHVPAPVVLVGGAAWIGRSVTARRPDLRAAGALVAGALLGLLLHPGLWDGSTFHTWELMAGSLDVASAGAVALSNGIVLPLGLPRELGRPGVDGLVRELWQPLVATGIAVVVGLRRLRQPAVLAGTLLAVAGLAATWRSGRFFEYWHVLALLGAALAVSGPGAPGPVRAHRVLLGGVTVVLGALTVLGMLPLVERKGADGSAGLRPAMEAISARARPGDVVWHASWDEFAPLFFHAPRLRYVQGMDPWWCVVHDPEGALAHRMIVDGAVEGDALRELLVARFDARFVVLWSQPEDGEAGRRQRRLLEARLDAVPWATHVHRDEAVTAYELPAR